MGKQIIMAYRRWIGMGSCSPQVTKESMFGWVLLGMVWAFDIIFCIHSCIVMVVLFSFFSLPILAFFFFSSVCSV